MCDTTIQSTSHQSRLDAALDMYRSSHASVARYSVLLGEFSPQGGHKKTKVDSGLNYEDAKHRRDELTKNAGPSRFGGKVYYLQLENSEEARAAVSKASQAFWSH